MNEIRPDGQVAQAIAFPTSEHRGGRAQRCLVYVLDTNAANGCHIDPNVREANDLRGDTADGQTFPESVSVTAENEEIRRATRRQLENPRRRISFLDALLDLHALRKVELLRNGTQHLLRTHSLLDRITAMPLARHVDQVQHVPLG